MLKIITIVPKPTEKIDPLQDLRKSMEGFVKIVTDILRKKYETDSKTNQEHKISINDCGCNTIKKSDYDDVCNIEHLI